MNRKQPIDDLYYYGKKCGRGHDGLRYKRGGGCVECGKIRTAKYEAAKKWLPKSILGGYKPDTLNDPCSTSLGKPRLIKGRAQSGSN